ncbi:Signal transduction histidine-protein kinase BarA [Nocardioides dokdonensis FR1436]|uniref:Circadian input-output histidine kinase CikA n=1 Tax=Nocardioides dokdonensis FR1436 TaxID=1300347 RepID=A0A1A9GRP3_9ACTN|nr:response regulator [Nocardioides dokdonensis]ANH40135.1 Signal transduction histidine-protein kinase BarA [Nocardioides dokdonensis FR1436]
MKPQDLYRDIVELAPNGIWVIDLDGRTLYANAAMARLYGVDHDEMQHVPMQDSLDEVGRGQLEQHLAEVRAGHLNTSTVEVQLVRRDASVLWVLVRESLLHDAEGSLTALLMTFDDYTERRETVQALEESQHRLREAQQIAQIGSWTWDLETDEMTGSEQLDVLFAVNSTTAPWTFEGFLGRVHPEERDLVRDLVLRGIGSGEGFDLTARVQVEGVHRWARARGVLSQEGSRRCLTGTLQDVTETKTTEIALADQAAQNNLMQTVASAANDASSFDELLRQARHLVLLHDDWERARAFVVADDDVQPLYVDEASAAEDRAAPGLASSELALARTVLEERTAVWDEARLTIAFPVLLKDEVWAVLTITSAPPLFRHDMIEQMAAHVGDQMSRVAWRQRTLADLAEARDQAMEASRQKSEFLATMSHEIRTPLNGVIGLNDLLIRTALTTEQQRLAAGVQVASRALLGVINDILDFSKIEAGRLELEVLDFEVRPVLDQVVGVLAGSARAKGVELSLSCAAEVPRVVAGDPTKLAQVLTNLVSNAVKFTEHGRVDVEASTGAPDPSLDPDDTVLVVSVTDTGIGIPPEKRAGLFDPFTQADASTTRVYGGTGLGLAISHEIVKALGGRLEHTPNPRGGAVFTVTVPLGAPSGEVVDAGDERARELLAGRRLLVVDDNPDNRLILVEQLGWWGLNPDSAASVTEALAAVDAATRRGAAYDAVLLDMAMPERDGLDLARTLRADPAHDATALLMLTSMTHLEGAELRRAGLDDCLVKPVLSGVLRGALLQHLSEAPDTSTADVVAPSETRHRVLVVEDNPVNQMVAAGLLEHLGYEHGTVDDGQAAVEAVARGGWDAVLMDVQMPVLDGYEATRRIRTAEVDGARLPIIAMTAAAIEGERERCSRAGMDDYLTKPVDPAALAATLARWLDGPTTHLAPARAGTDPERTPMSDPGTEQGATPPTDDPATAGLDLDRLEMLREIDEDNTDYLDRAIGNFMRNSVEGLRTMTENIEAGDAAALRQSSHKLAGGALNLGVTYAGEAVRAIELVSDSGSVEGAAALLPAAEEALDRGRTALGAYQEWYRGLHG